MRQKGRSRQVLALSKVAAAGPQENPAGPGAPVLGGPFQLLLVTMGDSQWLRPLEQRHVEQRLEVK